MLHSRCNRRTRVGISRFEMQVNEGGESISVLHLYEVVSFYLARYPVAIDAISADAECRV